MYSVYLQYRQLFGRKYIYAEILTSKPKKNSMASKSLLSCSVLLRSLAQEYVDIIMQQHLIIQDLLLHRLN